MALRALPPQTERFSMLVPAASDDQTPGQEDPQVIRALLTPMLALVLTACGADGEAPGEIPARIRDSADIRIVEYAGVPETELPFTLAPEPVYRHGAGTDNYKFSSISRGVLLGDGSAAIYDANNREVVLLGSGGRSGSVLARPGEGPGDVGSVTAMFARGRDSLFLQDFANARFTLFVGSSLARATGIPAEFSLAFGANGIGPDGEILMSSTSYRRGFPEDWLPGYMVRFDLANAIADTIAAFDYVAHVPPDHLPQNPFPYFGLVAAIRGEFVFGRTDLPELTWRRPDGPIRQIVRWEPEWVYPTDEHWEPFANDIRETAHLYNPQAQSDDERAALVERMLGRYELSPDLPLPLFSRPFGDSEGRVWLPSYRSAGAREGTSRYTVIAADGEWLGRVTVRAGLDVLDVAGGRVLGVMKGEMDVESVVVFELMER